MTGGGGVGWGGVGGKLYRDCPLTAVALRAAALGGPGRLYQADDDEPMAGGKARSQRG